MPLKRKKPKASGKRPFPVACHLCNAMHDPLDRDGGNKGLLNHYKDRHPRSKPAKTGTLHYTG